MRRTPSLANTWSSMKLLRPARRAGSTGRSNGTVTTTTATSVWKAARMAVSPLRSTRTLPKASTSATPGSLELNFVSQVTSRVLPSLNSARTASCSSSPGFIVRSPGTTSSFFNTGSSLSGPGARANPVEQHAVRPAADVEDLAALMRRQAAGLAQEQALFRRVGADATAAELARQPLVIQFGGIAAEGEAESVLAGRFSVAGALIAAETGEDGNDVVDERGRRAVGVGGGGGEEHGGAPEGSEEGTHGIPHSAGRSVR